MSRFNDNDCNNLLYVHHFVTKKGTKPTPPLLLHGSLCTVYCKFLPTTDKSNPTSLSTKKGVVTVVALGSTQKITYIILRPTKLSLLRWLRLECLANINTKSSLIGEAAETWPVCQHMPRHSLTTVPGSTCACSLYIPQETTKWVCIAQTVSDVPGPRYGAWLWIWIDC